MRRLFACAAVVFGIAASLPVAAWGLQTVPTERWDRGAVERVLHLFAYGGRVTEGQIRKWMALGPTAAIEQMLTLDSYNPYLAPRHDGINNHTHSLESLRSLFNSGSTNNPMCSFRRRDYDTFQQWGGEAWYFNYSVQRSWLAATHLRGGNPFRHKVGFWLTNHLMATSIPYTVIPLIRDHYDTATRQLASGAPLWQVLAEGAASAAISAEYGLTNATFNNNTGAFVGSDDFAREFHKLFFKISGQTDGIEYHEQVTIKNTALLLTGMGIDRELPPAGIPVYSWQLLKAPIDFTDHTDAEGNRINNQSLHHQAPLEILHTTIDGINAKEKLYDLASVAALHIESLANIPVEIVSFFGDDNLSPDKIAQIRQTWAELVGQPHDFLLFLRRYAISTAFHDSATYKYMTAFDQEIVPWNISSADNMEFYLANTSSSVAINLANNFVEPFFPIYRIFGHQTGLVAANDTSLFRRTYNTAVASGGPHVLPVYCDERQGSTQRDWRRMVPADSTGRYVVWKVARWLWSRLTGDSGANFTKLERAHLAAILARGTDLATVIDPTRPSGVYTAADLEQPALASLITSLETSTLPLASGDAHTRLDANSRVSQAVSFIRATPFAFAVEGR